MHRNRNENKSEKALDISKVLLNVVQQKVKKEYKKKKKSWNSA